MAGEKKNAIIVSVSSDIGTAMAKCWLQQGWGVWGTHRTRSESLLELENAGVTSVHCDLSSDQSVADACAELRQLCPEYDVIVLCPGTQAPVGQFEDVDIAEWRESIQVNFTSQLAMVHGLLPTRRIVEGDTEPMVLFFAGGATNSAVVKYSGYMISKIALIKMCELLDAEILDTRFTIIGPGWVGTKIHEETLRAGERAGSNFEITRRKLVSDELTPMDVVLDCCDWAINSPRDVISGRNFAVVFDRWGEEGLDRLLRGDKNMYKLRRHGNDAFVRNEAPK